LISRVSSRKVLEMAKKFPVITITGPRQSGKTTLCKSVFSQYACVSLENPDTREFAQSDPKGFLDTYTGNLIIDEAQHVPELFSYIQGIVDEKKQTGQFILSGSQNFLLLEKISQSLAGRVYVFHLLPLSYAELKNENVKDLKDAIFYGGYPRLFDANIAPKDFFPSYIQTYLERDVRNMINLRDLNLFNAFLKLCAGRIGQLFNANSLSTEIGVDAKTIQNWISILEKSFVVFRLYPWHENFNKRVIKTPKLYFYDTGLACGLLGIKSVEELELHFAKGGLFENFIILEKMKLKLNMGEQADLFFWRDSHGNEIDVLETKGNTQVVTEIKSAKTLKNDFFKGLQWYEKIAKKYSIKKQLVYGGDDNQKRTEAEVISWRNIDSF
jgi:predicted AAA+ superfamily ATPase